MSIPLKPMRSELFSTTKILIFAVLASFMSCKQSLQNRDAQKPNIIIILADDLGYGDPEVYNTESKIPTPNINALAQSGIRFTNAHAPSSVCTPTRYGILTGQYAWRTPLKSAVLWMWDKPLIEKDRLTMPKMLKSNGYNTASIGKWHLGWRWKGLDNNYMNDTIPIGDYSLKGRNELWKKIDFTKPIGGGPLEAGFDYYFGDDVPNFAPYAYIENNTFVKTPDTLKLAGMYGGPGPMTSGWDLTEVMPTITAKSVAYIEEQAESDKPFFLYFALTAPHTPIAPTKNFIGKSKAGLYGDFVHEVDWTVGEIIAALKRTGQLDNTLVVFTSDNGSPQRDGQNMGGATGSVKKYGHDPSRPLKGIKADIWEGGHRVPFIVSWPKQISNMQVSDQLIGLNDLMATFSAITNDSKDAVPFEDSMDFSTVLQTNEKTPIREDLVHHSIKGMFAIRKGSWKFIDGIGSGGWSGIPVAKKGSSLPKGQLYNLDTDLGEKNNLYDQYPDIVETLRLQLKQYKEQGYSNPNFKK
ncbi:arylsulfatase [Cellulophaga sp. F20128]|uniref:sulfatase family protein n=1 Tax=Cellulophaga sp. F20128 TaxID=2926413 RepID=UPI001FF57D3F|nr:arylsulfatase [Cellulophaga sp. F20128]MCK0157160.1 arylsulfatase [Cellulophaga sp. F20128]